MSAVVVDEKKLKDSIQKAAADAKQLAEDSIQLVKQIRAEIEKLPADAVTAINTAHKGFFDSVQRRAEQLLALTKVELPCSALSCALLVFSIGDLRPAYENMLKIQRLQETIRINCAIKPSDDDVSMMDD